MSEHLLLLSLGEIQSGALGGRPLFTGEVGLLLQLLLVPKPIASGWVRHLIHLASHDLLQALLHPIQNCVLLGHSLLEFFSRSLFFWLGLAYWWRPLGVGVDSNFSLELVEVSLGIGGYLGDLLIVHHSLCHHCFPHWFWCFCLLDHGL